MSKPTPFHELSMGSVITDGKGERYRAMLRMRVPLSHLPHAHLQTIIECKRLSDGECCDVGEHWYKIAAVSTEAARVRKRAPTPQTRTRKRQPT
jgi:hypothetical protein